MRTFLKFLAVLAVLGGIGGAAYKPAAEYMKQRNKPQWREAAVTRGRVVSVVNATGSIKPVLSVSVGAFVSGPIKELNAEFNQEVTEGEILAKIDPRLYAAAVKREEANLLTRQADVLRVKAQLQQAINDEKRVLKLKDEDASFVAQAELDKFRFAKEGLEAQLEVAKAAVEVADASLVNTRVQLDYTEIQAPVSGIIINRKIDKGQTLAAQFQTPELFVIAPDMRKKMHVHASVDEADIGLIRDAQHRKLPVVFTVDAYPDDLFEGTIEEIRLSSTTTQNVVTYPVVVAAPNPDLKLLPGMTASLSFKIDEREDVLRVPNTALRFYPDPKRVRVEDRALLEGLQKPERDEESSEPTDVALSAAERAEARKKRNRRHVWVNDGEFLRAVEVELGLNDSKYSELVSGQLGDGEKLVTGLQPPR